MSLEMAQSGLAAPNRAPVASSNCANVPAEAIPAGHRKDFEAMARRRFQDPKPERVGKHWYIRIYQDSGCTRKRKRVKLAPASMPEREVKKVAAEILRPVNQGLVTAGSAVSFNQYVQTIYNPTDLPLLATTTQDAYRNTIGKYLEPEFGSLCLRDLTPLTLQQYFSGPCHEQGRLLVNPENT